MPHVLMETRRLPPSGVGVSDAERKCALFYRALRCVRLLEISSTGYMNSHALSLFKELENLTYAVSQPFMLGIRVKSRCCCFMFTQVTFVSW